MVLETRYPHIAVNEQGQLVFAGTRFKLLTFIEGYKAADASAQAVEAAFPDLSKAQIYAGLAFYYDNLEWVEAQIQQRLDHFDQSKAQSTSTMRERLKS